MCTLCQLAGVTPENEGELRLRAKHEQIERLRGKPIEDALEVLIEDMKRSAGYMKLLSAVTCEPRDVAALHRLEGAVNILRLVAALVHEKEVNEP